ncbi:NAD(P)H-binding protein [Planomonospora parontospora]|uniref:NAD(P)H-binding protein n=1 Tax=Planomonospora parontospora TaxID=58119 RepID=UPI00167167CB|nr:NAD(P)H-binding protein [Planomonospora parontospora]
MTQNDAEKTTLVTGGTGKTGRRVAAGLRARGLPVRIGSRSGNPPFDWNDPGTWEPALRDAGSVYLSYQPDLVAPGAVEAVGALAGRAVAAGARRLVLLSGRGEEEAERAEEAVRDSGAEWTVVRASWFCQNFDEGHLLEPVLGGAIALPAGDVAEPFADAGDIADVAVAALTEPGHAGRVYEVTGPRLLTFADAAEEIAEASGREVRYVPVSVDGYASMLVEYGVPAGEAEMLAAMFGKVLDGRNAHLGDGVRRALGRDPRDFTDYAEAAAATGVWKG